MTSAVRRLAAAAALFVPLACVASGLDGESLDRSIRALHTAAHEAQTLLTLASQGAVPSPFLRVQSEELAKIVRDAAKPLDAPAPADLASRAARAKAISERLGTALEKQDGAAATAAARELDGLAKGTR